MKTKLLIGFLAVSLLAAVVMHGCQSDGNESYYFEEEELTAADLFVASEDYQNLKKQQQKYEREIKSIISNFSKHDAIRYSEIKETIKKADSYDSVIEELLELNDLLGFDYVQRLKERMSAVEKVYEGVEFSHLEFIRALQKYNSNHFSLMKTKSGDEFDIDEETRKDQCKFDKEDSDDKCYWAYHFAINLAKTAEERAKAEKEYNECLEDAKEEYDDCDGNEEDDFKL